MSKSREFILVIFIGAFISFIAGIVFNKSICLFINIFGLPCPSCGMTRAYISLGHLDIKKAFYYHPLFWSVPLILLGYKNKKIIYILGILFISVWLVRMYLYFPDIEPMKFNNKAIYVRIFNGLKNIIK
ncbi:DUF2752 domain-containing protein [Fusobacterium sp.]|uniref:DUF2752 domain-containing protein n=1 Tax=Fusobacterium sp. TaxID=68766 RepID=UPI0029009765|nr:DUF2752 domain-containing protein [Fusobacterium sp.]MDU1911668.1 DUF2752 domain-containing protein [Fusobacterium sp.]